MDLWPDAPVSRGGHDTFTHGLPSSNMGMRVNDAQYLYVYDEQRRAIAQEAGLM